MKVLMKTVERLCKKILNVVPDTCSIQIIWGRNKKSRIIVRFQYNNRWKEGEGDVLSQTVENTLRSF